MDQLGLVFPIVRPQDVEKWQAVDDMTAREIIEFAARTAQMTGQQKAAPDPRTPNSTEPVRLLTVDKNYAQSTICGELFLKTSSTELNQASGCRVILFGEQVYDEAINFASSYRSFERDLKNAESLANTLHLANESRKDTEAEESILENLVAEKESFFRYGNVDYELKDPWDGTATSIDFHKNKTHAVSSFERLERKGRERVENNRKLWIHYAQRAQVRPEFVQAKLKEAERKAGSLRGKKEVPFCGLIPAATISHPIDNQILDSNAHFCFVGPKAGKYAVFCVFDGNGIESSRTNKPQYYWWCEPVELPENGKVEIVLSQENRKYESSTDFGAPELGTVADDK